MNEAIILAGGFGTRLRYVLNDVPKPMAPINGRPFLEYLLNYLKRYHFEHVVLSTGYLHEKIEDYFGNLYSGIRLSYAHETSPLGTGGGVLNAMQQCENDVVTVLNGDTLFCVDYNELQRLHSSQHTNLTIILRHVENTARYGAVQTDASGRIVAFTEKAAASGNGFINGGIYRLNRSLFEGFTVGQQFSFEKDLMECRYRQQSFYAYPSDAYFIDIGIPEDYARAQHELPNQ